MEMNSKHNPNNGLYDIQYLLDKGVVEQSEVVKVIEERQSFLKKVEKSEVNQEDCMSQITTELNLLDVCKTNINKRSLVKKMQSVNTEVFDMLVNRIDFLYFSMLQIFPIHLSTLKKYLNFRFTNKPYINDMTLLSKLMSKKHNDPAVYKKVAFFEYNQMNDVISARKCFSNGLKHHKHCKRLHIEDFSFEVQCVEDTNGVSIPMALLKYTFIISNFKDDLEFHFALLDKALRFNTVWELQFRVVRDMYDNYKDDERMWQKLAKINSIGFIFDYEMQLINFDRHCKRRLSYSIKAFDDGLKLNWSPEKRKILWNMFIEHIIEIWKEHGFKNETIANFVIENMERIFQEAFNEGFLDKAEHFLYWAEYRYEQSNELLSKAFEMNKHNLNAWAEILTLFVERDCFEMAHKVFQDAINSLDLDATMILWELMESFILNYNQNMLYDFYHHASYMPSTRISLLYRVKYLQWFGINNGISAIRKLFKELVALNPPCKQLYIDMISYEQSLSSVNVTQISKLYNEVCYNLGHGDIELWANYVRFEYMNVARHTAKSIYKSSLLFLGPELFDAMTTEFENIKNEFNKNLTINPEIIDLDEE